MRFTMRVNGGPLLPVTDMGGGVYEVVFITREADLDWPWVGFHVSLGLQDPGGARTLLEQHVVPGVTFSTFDGGLSALSSSSGLNYGICTADVNEGRCPPCVSGAYPFLSHPFKRRRLPRLLPLRGPRAADFAARRHVGGRSCHAQC